MKLEQQVSSLEPSNQLKKLEVKQDSLFYWGERDGKGWVFPQAMLKENLNNGTFVSKCKYYSAFTVAELVELIGDGLDIYMFGDACKLEINYLEKFIIEKKPYHLPDLLAKMLIYLLENKLINL